MKNQLAAFAALFAIPQAVSPQALPSNKSTVLTMCSQTAQCNQRYEVSDLNSLLCISLVDNGGLLAGDSSPHGPRIVKRLTQTIYVLAPNPKKKPLDAIKMNQDYLLLSL